MKRWPLYTIAVVSLLLIVVRMIWPLLRIDNTSLILLGVATVALLVALLPIKRIKWGEFEAELDRALDAVEKTVKATEIAQEIADIPKREIVEIDEVDRSQGGDIFTPRFSPEKQKIYDDYLIIVNAAISDVEKIVAATVLLEKVIAKAVTEAGLAAKGGRGPRAGVARLVWAGKITQEEEKAFVDAWNLRNRIIHEGIKPTSEQTARFLDILWRLIEKLG